MRNKNCQKNEYKAHAFIIIRFTTFKLTPTGVTESRSLNLITTGLYFLTSNLEFYSMLKLSITLIFVMPLSKDVISDQNGSQNEGHVTSTKWITK